MEVFDNIAIGRGGAGEKKHIGDDVTPRGSFKIGWINRKSHYHVFYGLDYPSPDIANRAYVNDAIDRTTYLAIMNAHDRNRTPPQNTVLGGQIGIHGLGRGDAAVHAMTNWTHGCIALTNRQINRMAKWIKIGTKVVVQ